MKRVILTPTFFPERGGTEQVIYELAKRTGDTVITMHKNAPPEEVIEKVKVKRIKKSSILANQLRMYNLLKRLKPDLIHQFHIFDLGWAAARYSKKFNVPLITTLAGWDTFDPVKPLPRICNPYVAWVMNSSDVVTAPCIHMKKMAVKQGCKKDIKVIPHGTSMPFKESGIVDIRKKYNINKRIVLSVGRLVKRKGFDILLEASKSVRDDIVFLVCGDGPLMEELKEKADERFIFPGFVPDEELKDYYLQSDLFVLPSLYEGFGLVYVDALSCGLPVVTTKCGGSEDFINEENGVMVPPGDTELLSHAIEYGLSKVWDRQMIRKKAMKYNWERIVREYKKIYSQFHDSSAIVLQRS